MEGKALQERKKERAKASFQQLLIVHILFFITRYFSRGLCKWLVQYNAKVDVKVSHNLILASARNRCVCGDRVSHKSKSKFRNITQVTREQIGYLWKLIRKLEKRRMRMHLYDIRTCICCSKSRPMGRRPSNLAR